MKSIKSLSLIVFIIFFVSCSTTRNQKTLGDPKNAQEIGYHPLDPLPVLIKHKNDEFTNETVLKSLPDETMRMAVGKLSASGGISFGTSNIGYKGNKYIVVLDYIKFTTNSIGVTKDDSGFILNTREPESIVPVYIGVGLRLTASITVNKGSVNLGNLFSIGVEASAEKISGSLVVQTLGISGESISASIPFPSELNSNTIQNAILALGAIKAKIYDDNTTITPRVVGVYNSLGGGPETINAFITSLFNNEQVLDITQYEK